MDQLFDKIYEISTKISNLTKPENRELGLFTYVGTVHHLIVELYKLLNLGK